MFPEIKEIIKNNQNHYFILSVDINYHKYDFNLDALKEILFIDIIKDSLNQDSFYNIIGDTFTYETAKKIILKNLQFFKTDNNLILGIKIIPQNYDE